MTVQAHTFTRQDFALAHVVGGGTKTNGEKVTDFAKELLNKFANEEGFGELRIASEQKQTTLDKAAFMMQSVSKLGFDNPHSGDKTPASSPKVALNDSPAGRNV